MGNLINNSKQYEDVQYSYPSSRKVPFTFTELNYAHYKPIIVDNFNKKELLKKYIDFLDERKLQTTELDNFNKIIKMIDHCEKKSKEKDKNINLDNMDCLCSQNLDVCFLKEIKKNEPYNYMEYVINPPGRVFLRI